MSKIHFNNTFSSGCVQFMAADWPATTAHKMIYLLTSYTVQQHKQTKNKNKKKPLFFHNPWDILQLKYVLFGRY